jgi:hypothetical protein
LFETQLSKARFVWNKAKYCQCLDALDRQLLLIRSHFL